MPREFRLASLDDKENGVGVNIKGIKSTSVCATTPQDRPVSTSRFGRH